MSQSRSYGTTPDAQNHSQQNGNAQSEHDSLLPKSNNSTFDLRSHFNAKVSTQYADLVLLYSYLTTGLLDSTATAVWGAFVSMQTGNTIYLGLGLASPNSSTRWIKSLLSIFCFCFGSYLFSLYHRTFSARRRWVLIGAVIIQLLCVLIAAVIVTLTKGVNSPGNGHDLHWHVLVPLGLVALQSSGQAVISRALQYNSLTSVVLTSIYCDLFGDAKLFVADNVERNRRVAAPLLLLIGAVLGGLWSKSAAGITGALWTAVGMKAVLVFVWAVWPPEKGEEES